VSWLADPWIISFRLIRCSSAMSGRRTTVCIDDRCREGAAVPNVIADITMSLDGFVTGEGADEQHGLGDAPELHA
jgi:hypothetical protein